MHLQQVNDRPAQQSGFTRKTFRASIVENGFTNEIFRRRPTMKATAMKTAINEETGFLGQISESTIKDSHQPITVPADKAEPQAATGLKSQFKFAALDTKHAEQVARLHIEGISTGFISSLGTEFVTALYEAIAQSKTDFSFVTSLVSEDNKVLGFAAFTSNLGKLYKSVVLKKGARFAFLLAGKMLSLQRIKKVFETLFYPSRIKKMNLPSAELLSIVVAPQARRLKLGTRLVQAGFDQCSKMGIDKVKVLVAAANEPANKLYLKCGFELAGQIDNHGICSNIYVARIAEQDQISKSPTAEIQQHRNLVKYLAEKIKSTAAVF
jgi:ribosomal protein S18 acetylase RimI-like enzyme